MPANVGPSDAQRFDWPSASETELAPAATRIARHLVRAGAPVVGLLPADAAVGPPDRLGPLMFRLAQALTGFTLNDVAIVDTWSTWPWGEVVEAGDVAAHQIRSLAPRLLSIAPVPCHDPLAATVALQNALAARPSGIGSVLVNLAGYAEPGTVPPAATQVDGVVLLAVVRRSRFAAVADLAGRLPGKSLGTILLGR